MAEVGTHDDLAAYEIQDVIGLEDATERGRGSFGAVYEVEVYGVPCVAKCLHDILIGYQQQFKGPMKLDEEGVDAIRSKFRDECTLHCQLRHPNIVQFLGIHYGMYSGELALIVERLQWDLGKFVEAYKEISESIKVSFLLDVAYGLMYLHNRTPSVIHRDLSAGNVLISGEGKAKIADLGASKIFQMSAFQAHTAGQPGAFAYMPPEALQPNPQYDQSFDIFSFGAVALYTATQKFPFAHEIAPSVREVQNGEIQIAKRRVAIEQAQNSCLLPLIKNCLFDNPQSRPSTSKLCIHLKQLASRNPRISGDFSKILGKEKDADIISLKEEVSKLQEQTRSQLEFREVQRQHILKMSADRAVLIEEYGSHVQSLTLKCDRSAESLQRGQEEIAHLKLEMVTLNKEKNEAVINQSQLQQELQKMQRTFDMERQDSASGRISLERELQELKDRNTALEHQLLEYAETISDLSKSPRPAMATNPNPIPGLSMSEANPTHCPLCNTPVAGSGGLQLHYFTSCETYDRLSNEQPRLNPSATLPTSQHKTFREPPKQRDDHHFQLETELASLNMKPSKTHRKRTTSGSRAKQYKDLESPRPAMVTNPNPIPDLSISEANPTHCPLCNTPVAGSDGLALHYLTSCET